MPANDLHEDWKDLLWYLRRSTRYHMHRVRFFDTFHTYTMAMGLLFTSATVVISPEWTVAVGVLVTILFSLDLVIGTTRKARFHHELARRFLELEQQTTLEASPSDAVIRRTRGEILRIEQDEPPALKLLNDICHNELVLAMGYPPRYLLPIPRYKKLLAHFLSFEPIVSPDEKMIKARQ